MADHFLTKTRIDRAACLPWGAGLAIEGHAALRAALEGRVSPQAAALLAEPLVSRGNDAAPATVAWYSEHPGEAQPLSALDEAGQARLGAALARALAELRPLLADPAIGPLLGSALHLAGSAEGDIWSVGGAPVLVNWGMLPPGTPRDPASRSAHFARTLGSYMALAKAPPVTEAERAALAAAAGAAAPAAPSPAAAAAAVPASGAAGAGAPPPPPPAPRVPPAGGRPVPVIAWAPLVVLLVLAAAALAWLLAPGNRIFPAAGPAAIDESRAAAIAAEVNASLEARRAALQEALEGAQCRADGTLVVPGGRTIEGLLPPRPGNPADAPGRRSEGSPFPMLPPDPARVQVPGGEGETTLLGLIEARTAMVIAETDDGVSTGTGFFIAPDLLVTNHHVVAGVRPDRLAVINRGLGSMRAAEILAAAGPFEETGTDFALLRVPGAGAPFFPVYDGSGRLKLQAVIAAGYPGDVLETDAAFAALRSGDAAAVPDLAVTDGTVSTEQQLAEGIGAVVHSAPISQGNSGGPLVDMCGRIVGVNTFVRQGDLRNLNFALAAPTLTGFLRGAGVTPDLRTETCQPGILRPSAAAAVPAPPAEAGPPAAPAAPAPAGQ